MRIFSIVILSIVFIIFSKDVIAKEKNKKEVAYDSTLVAIEKEISGLAKQLYALRRDDVKSLEISQQINTLFINAFKIPEAFSYPFDSIYPVGKVKSEKGEFQIFTWNIVLKSGKCKHFGFLSYQDKNLQKSYSLIDNSDNIEEVLSASLSYDNWLGANYYQVVETKNTDGHYILLGWKGNNLHSNKKVIETLYFTESGKPKFGKSLIKVERKKYKRLVFEFSRMTDMLLTYDANYDLIVFDHLSPSSGVQSGDYQFYGSDLSYDALKYSGDFWEYLSAIDYKRIPNKKRRKR